MNTSTQSYQFLHSEIECIDKFITMIMRNFQIYYIIHKIIGNHLQN